MPQYVFSFKKDDIVLEVYASDHRFISHQADLWLKDIINYSLDSTKKVIVTEEKPKEKIQNAVIKEEQVEELPVQAKVTKIPETVTPEIPVEKPQPQKIVKSSQVAVDKPVMLEKPVIKEVVEVTPMAAEKVVIKEEKVLPKPESLKTETKPLPEPELAKIKAEEQKVNVVKETLNNVVKKVKLVQMHNEKPKEKVIEQPVEIIAEEPEEIEYQQVEFEESDDTEEVYDAETDDTEEVEEFDDTEEEIVELDDIEDLEAAHSIIQKSVEADKNNFYQILQEKFSALPDMVTEKVDEKLSNEKTKPTVSKTTLEFSGIEDIINYKKPQTLLDYMLITTYYLKMHDMLDKYSLKQINSKVLSYTKKLIDHGVIQEAVAQNYLEVVPDYTGMADVTEYVITQEGINYLLNVM